MDERGLAYSEENLTQGIYACEADLEPSPETIENMSSKEFKEKIVDPTFRDLQAKQPKPEPGNTPLGVRWTRYLHEQ
jgi:hypothetical protein